MDSQTLKVNIIRARRNNPCASLKGIGVRYGISRERVRQVLSEAGKQTSSYRQTYLCNQCGKDIGTQEKLFCNRQCRYDYTHIDIACSYCGKLREYQAKHIIWEIKHGLHSSDIFFCSKNCQGHWAAEKHGFIAHPENGGRGRNKKWDYDKVYQARDETGFGGTKLSRLLSIPESTIYMILAKRSNHETQT